MVLESGWEGKLKPVLNNGKQENRNVIRTVHKCF
jgi:hypothetical protein